MSLENSREMARLREKLGVELLWIYILGILKKKPSHAYAIRAEIEKRFGFRPGNVTAYVVLYKLEGRGFVSKKTDANREVYSITAKGKELLKEAGKEFVKKQRILFKH